MVVRIDSVVVEMTDLVVENPVSITIGGCTDPIDPHTVVSATNHVIAHSQIIGMIAVGGIGGSGGKHTDMIGRCGIRGHHQGTTVDGDIVGSVGQFETATVGYPQGIHFDPPEGDIIRAVQGNDRAVGRRNTRLTRHQRSIATVDGYGVDRRNTIDVTNGK